MRTKWLCWLGSTLIILSALSCGGSSSSPTPTPTPTPPSVTVSPETATLSPGAAQQFTATIANATDQTVSWEVNNVQGGSATYGLISEGGVYIAPTNISGLSSVTVTAVSFDDPTKTGTATVTFQSGSSVKVVIAANGAPIPVLTFGSYTLSATVSGTTNTALTWQVNGVTGGGSTTGTVTQAGVYYAPHSVPVSTAANNDGQTTDVILTAISQADTTASDSVIVVPTPPQTSRFPLPVPLGTSGGNAHDLSTSGNYTFCCGGTIGSLVSRGGQLYILSCNHVLARSDAASIGDAIIQPGLIDNNCAVAGTNTVANLSQFFNLETGALPNVDAAIAEIVSGAVEPLGTILELGGTASGSQPTDGTPNPGPGVTPTVGRPVAKSGRSTGLTCSQITSVSTSISVEYQKGCNTGSTYDVDFDNQVDVSGVGFSAFGDSGSLIVTQDTSDPVGLLFAGSDTDTVANPLDDVLSQLADPSTGEKPVFVGDSTVGAHAVAACSIPQPTSSLAVILQGQAALSNLALEAATAARDAHAEELMTAHPEIQALGVGASCDNPRESAVLLFVPKGPSHAGLPPLVGGIRTRIVEVTTNRISGSLSAEESSILIQSVALPPLAYAISEAEVERAKAVQSAHRDALMRQHGVQGVGVTSSLDSPGEAALMIFVIRGVAHDPIPPVIDGLRTRIRETSRFRAR